ncbi:hypothetical protein [Anditalea andensis]|uniref:Uncharacterized protein n=1 Tax=Anditalea andensis TaxID=1048983 RepID=A0A074KYX6_9BACT|nr:hypothetical protein [Anditalea andensis]KEO73440.1 hypothetical protein EL17_13970 [Anditalea andensis]
MTIKKIQIVSILSFTLIGGGFMLSIQQDANAEVSINATCQYDDAGCVNTVTTNMCYCEVQPVVH